MRKQAWLLGLMFVGCFAAHGATTSVVPDARIPGPREAQIERPAAVFGDILLLGYPGSSQNASDTGSVHVYRRDAVNCETLGCWAFVRALEPRSSQAGQRFGASIAFDGETAIIGAPAVSAGEEAAYVYAYDAGAWTLRQELRGDAADGPTNFGRRIALDGDTLAIASVGYGRAGAVHVFTRDVTGHWTRQDRLSPASSNADDQFGQSLALHENTLLVGSNQASVAGQGAAYVFERRGGKWSLPHRLIASDGLAGDNFGHAVAVHGDVVIVTSQVADYGGVGPDTYGAAYLFFRAGAAWSASQKFFPVSDLDWQAFGTGILLTPTAAAVAAIREEEHDGAVYWFELREGVWSDVRRYWVPDPPLPFGMASDGETLVVTTRDATWIWDLSR